MKQKPRDESPFITELDELTFLITRPEWRQFVKLMRERTGYLQGKINHSVRHKDLDEARWYLSKLDDVQKIIDKVQNKINELRKQKEKGEH